MLNLAFREVVKCLGQLLREGSIILESKPPSAKHMSSVKGSGLATVVFNHASRHTRGFLLVVSHVEAFGACYGIHQVREGSRLGGRL